MDKEYAVRVHIYMCVYTYTHICIHIQSIQSISISVSRYTFSHKKKSEVMPFAASWMNLEITILSEVSQKDKDKHHMISLTCGI